MKLKKQTKLNKIVYLSHILDRSTPSYGNRNQFEIVKKTSIANGDPANDSLISTTVHIGTHIDLPYHFYENGQTIEQFEAFFFEFKNVLFISLAPESIIIKDDLVKKLESVQDKEKYEIIIVKTGICHIRSTDEFSTKNYGFSPELAGYIRKNFPDVRMFGFDSISVASFSERAIGREAHKAFLQPELPLILLEDMDLSMCDSKTKINHITIAPLRAANCDGLPCTVIAYLE